MKGLVKRTPKDKILDRFLTLYVLTKASKRPRNLGRTQLQKIVFLSEWKMISQKMKGFNYNYIRLTFGPYSPELQDDMKRFAKLGETQDDTLVPTEATISTMEDFTNIVENNKPFFSIIDKYTLACTSVDLETLLKHVYALRHPIRKNMTIGQTPLRTPILYPMDESNADLTFRISKNDLEDLTMSLDNKIVKNVEEGMADVKAGRLIGHREIFRSV